MKSFEFSDSRSLAEVDSLADGSAGTRFFAGGTDLLGTIRDRIHPQPILSLVNIKRIEELGGIRPEGDELRIGAAVSVDELAADPLVRAEFPGLAEAAGSVASPQLRRMGTVGGNICQEPRCWYYRYPDNFFHCLRKGGVVCNAVDGENRFHSIFGSVRVERTPCSRACPNSADIPGQLALIREGRPDLAATRLLSRNPLPSVTGRVCPRFCETGCARGEVDQAVSVAAIERSLGDLALDRAGEFYLPPERESGRKAAIIGSGPAGLSAACHLRRQGVAVTVFDSHPAIGGMLTHSLPEYRLPGEVMTAVEAAWRSMGVEFRLGVRIDDQSLARLRAEHNAVILATGAWRTVSIGLSGEEKTLSGLDFLTRVRAGEITAVETGVIVVGGGNVAVDAAVTARRLGAEQVTVVCLEGRGEMPADEAEVQLMLQEGVELRTGWGASRLLEVDGSILGLETVKCVSVFDAKGNFSPRYQESVRETFRAGQVILAVGQRPGLDFPDNGPRVDSGRVAADEKTQATDMPGVWACGDMVTGPATVAQAIAAGRRAAVDIAARLGLDGPEPLDADASGSGPVCRPLGDLEAAREPQPLKPSEERTVGDEDLAALTDEQLAREAKRCLDCGCLAVSPTDIGPALVVLEAVMVTTTRRIPARDFFDVGVMKSTVLEPDELLKEIVIPRPEADGTGSAYAKFRIRRSIDFAIAGAAVWLLMADGLVQEARICLGAAAPVPMEASRAANWLRGRELTEKTAAETARLAVAGASPLAHNAAKIQITGTMVKRALLSAARRCAG